MGPIDPIRPVRLISRQPRQPPGAEETPAPVVNVTVNVGQAPANPPTNPYQPPTNLDAHLIAQQARTRGLRGGQKVLDTARHVYLETEYSGPRDRRIPTGKITKTEA
jgi:hypothetical protein